ncbi:MAG TPA: NADH-quinone oxidoreductase subunit NuoK, partial [Candidatus Marinimicrobia bacterium]|nr:NADH-quinone oxidoreductase subunit NuoK [Candidatus Neomarinimicrobiota bacterium]
MNHLESYLILSALLFSLGLYTVITRKNGVAILMGIELILNAANINFVAFSKFVTHQVEGHLMAI